VIRSTTGPTCISRSVVVTYAMNSSRLSSTSSSVTTDCTRGTDVTRSGSVALSYEVRTSSENRNVDRKTVSVSLLIRLRTKIRTTRGVSCPLAICTATSEMLKTTPMRSSWPS
jgi:hypothetical protein